jgi:tetratricopeptide (TPR) repeat protein
MRRFPGALLLGGAVLICEAAFGQANSQNQGWQLTGRVVLNDGGAPPGRVAVESFCNGVSYVSAQTDRKGDFSFRVGPAANPVLQSASVGREDGSFGRPRGIGGGAPAAQSDDAPASASTQNDAPAAAAGRRLAGADPLRNCELRFQLAGYLTDPIPLAGRQPADGPDLGLIVMRPLVAAAGDTVSVTSLGAPAAARKAFERGMKQLREHKPAAARQSLGKAVGIYPKFAAAWCELGILEADQRRYGEAQRAFAAAAASDSRFVEPRVRLAALQAREFKWAALVDTTAQLLKLDGNHQAHAYYLNAVAHYNTGNPQAAEKSARAAEQLDLNHEFPRSCYLLGTILAERGEFQEAAEALRRYLSFAPGAPDAAAARAQLARLERTAAIAEKR